jgi:hypothetical protein
MAAKRGPPRSIRQPTSVTYDGEFGRAVAPLLLLLLRPLVGAAEKKAKAAAGPTKEEQESAAHDAEIRANNERALKSAPPKMDPAKTDNRGSSTAGTNCSWRFSGPRRLWRPPGLSAQNRTAIAVHLV